MDPWIEHPALWPDVHQRLITYACDQLQSAIGAAYFVAIGVRVYLETPQDRSYYPDVSVTETQRRSKVMDPLASADEPAILVLDAVDRRETFLEIRDAQTGNRVVTVIEVLSPSTSRS